MSELVIATSGENQKTISSVKLCELINKIRKEEGVKATLLHKNLLVKIKEELEDTAAKFLAAEKYRDGLGLIKEKPIYNLPHKEALQIIASESKRVRRKLIDEIEKLTVENNQLRNNIVIDSYMEPDPIKRAKLWLEEQEKNKLLIQEKNGVIMDKEETIELIRDDRQLRSYKKQLRSDIVEIAKKINKNNNISFQSIYEDAYKDLMKEHHVNWKLDFLNSKNKLDYLMNKDIVYLKNLKEIVVGML